MTLARARYFQPPPARHAPKHIVARLARFHPTVRLVWNTVYKCWQLIERGNDLRWTSLRLLRNAQKQPITPTMESTVHWLSARDIKRLGNKHALERWLEGLDATGFDGEREAEARASGMIEEGADRQMRAEGRRIPFVLNPSHGNGADSGTTGGPSSPAGE